VAVVFPEFVVGGGEAVVEPGAEVGWGGWCWWFADVVDVDGWSVVGVRCFPEDDGVAGAARFGGIDGDVPSNGEWMVCVR